MILLLFIVVYSVPNGVSVLISVGRHSSIQMEITKERSKLPPDALTSQVPPPTITLLLLLQQNKSHFSWYHFYPKTLPYL